MCLKKILFILTIAAAICLGSNPALAIYKYQDLGTLSIGASGSFSFVSPSGGYGSEDALVAKGLLRDPNSKITITYQSFGYEANFGQVDTNATAFWVSTPERPHYDGMMYASHLVDDDIGINIKDNTHTYTESGAAIMLPLTFVSAQIDKKETPGAEGRTSKGTSIIKNLSTNSSDFTVFTAMFTQNIRGPKGGTILASYEVTATPLPAALPMFAFGLAGIVGLRRRKQNA